MDLEDLLRIVGKKKKRQGRRKSNPPLPLPGVKPRDAKIVDGEPNQWVRLASEVRVRKRRPPPAGPRPPCVSYTSLSELGKVDIDELG